nr:sigma-70 family RNA polymerase sigma factor [uncultured Terrisporobacter sp.]
MLIYLSLLDSEEEISKFELIYSTYKKQMYYTANNILKDSHLAEDAVHNAFLRIINNLEKIEDINSHKTKGLIVIIVKNVSIDIYRKNKKERDNTIFIDDLDDINGYDEINKNEIGDLEIAISKLPENYKQVFLLKFSHELTDNEISEILDIKPDNVRKRISRGREKLKNILKKMEVYSIG